MFLKLALLLVLGVAFSKVYAEDPERVVGGTDASPGELPYQVSLRYNGKHFCGGTIVSSTQIITAAHCINGIVEAPWTKLTVVSGSNTIIPHGQVHRVKNVRVHPNFMDNPVYSWVNDIAVIYLEEPMKFNEFQKSIPLATSEPNLRAPLTISGWGRLKHLGDLPNNLQKVTVYYLSNEQCQNFITTMSIRKTQLCAFHSRGIGTCHGDSGGPLVHNGHLVGVVSWAALCAAGYPDVYTRVSEYGAFLYDIPRA